MRGLIQSVKGAVLAKALVVAGLAAPVLAMAETTGVDFTPLTSQVDFTTTVTAVLAVAGALVLLYVSIKGAKIVLRMIRSA